MTTAPPVVLGSLEAGGTKILCAKWDGDGAVIEQARLPTDDPNTSVPKIIRFFQDGVPVAALGVGSFGPLCLNPRDPRYGSITATPKAAWRGFPLLGALRTALGVPVALATDVEAAALGEGAHGAAQGLDHFAYVTVGTGVGCAAVVDGQVLRGGNHTEIGHIYPPLVESDRDFPGSCPYHGRCLEGLASGPSIEQRTGQRGETLPADHLVWAAVAHYIAHLCIVLDGMVAPQRIVLGGGVLESGVHHPAIRSGFARLQGSYGSPRSASALEGFIVTPGAPHPPALLGARLLAAAELG